MKQLAEGGTPDETTSRQTTLGAHPMKQLAGKQRLGHTR